IVDANFDSEQLTELDIRFHSSLRLAASGQALPLHINPLGSGAQFAFSLFNIENCALDLRSVR
ncbi:MAG TPA: hypothetical protein VN345_16750, partial [Blastocatellia bacterium]|nr:hypothetical protein [Blastocatellia bacterium]